MLIEYDSNNSGGSWWLTDQDWKLLEDNGWKVAWHPGGRRNGSLARSAKGNFEDPGQAMRRFEEITGADVTDDGCNCCGAPHSFSWEGGYASGEDCIPYLFKGKTLKTKRQLYEDQTKETD